MARQPAMLRTLEEKIDPAHTALLVVDMQKDFCCAGGVAERSGRDLRPANRIVPALQSLLAGAREKGALPVFILFSTLRDHLSDSGPWLDQRSRSTYSAADMTMEGSWGQEVIDELRPLPTEPQVKKHRYSGFVGTDLDLILRSHGIRTLIVTGVSTNICVESTARDGFHHEYYVVMPEDAVASWSESLHEGTLENIRRRFGIVCRTDDILRIWRERY